VTPLIDSLFSAPYPLVLLLAALLVMIGLVVLHLMRSERIVRAAEDLLQLAQEGRADEARIRARRAGKPMQPVLDALAGEVIRPPRRSMLHDSPWVLLLAAPAMAFGIYTLSMLRVESESRVPVATVLLLGTAVLLPIAFAAAIAMFEISRRASRSVRGTCITLLAQNVKSSVDLDRKDALRRGTKKDPRGD
jgi:hypothetical protein